MTKPKMRADFERSPDVDWPPHQPITLMDLVAAARAVDWDFTTWCYASGQDANDPDARLIVRMPTDFTPDARAAQA